MRLLMVLSSLAPLFLLMSIRGNSLFPELYFVSICLAFAILPSFFLWLRIHIVRRVENISVKVVGSTEDHRSHVLVYLFATLLPFYREDIGTYRDLIAMIVAIGLIIYLFWRLRLHYLNIFFEVRGYRIFSVSPPKSENPFSGKDDFILITRRKYLPKDLQVFAYQISETVHLEKQEKQNET